MNKPLLKRSFFFVKPHRSLIRPSFPWYTAKHVKLTRGLSQVKTGSNQDQRPKNDDSISNLIPGLTASALVMQGGFFLADILGRGLLSLQGIDPLTVTSPISGIPCSILLGLLIKNTLSIPEMLNPGIKFAQKTVLQAGVVCVGAKLSALDLVTTGLVGLPAVCLSVGTGLIFVPWFGNKMGLPHKMSSLIAAGTSICGT